MADKTQPDPDTPPADEEPVEGTATEIPPENGDSGGELVVHDGHDVFRVLDRHDEDLVVKEITGDMLETMAYEFTVSGKKARGLSYAGVNAAVRILNARKVACIECPPFPRPQYAEIVDEEGDAAWECEVYAIDRIAGGGAWGRATQKKAIKLRSGEERPDTFAKTKALSKAQRNAKLALIDERLKAQIIAGVTSGQLRRIETGSAEAPEPAELPPHDTSPAAKKVDRDNEKAMKALGLKPAKQRELKEWARTLEDKEKLAQKLSDLADRQAQEAPA